MGRTLPRLGASAGFALAILTGWAWTAAEEHALERNPTPALGEGHDPGASILAASSSPRGRRKKDKDEDGVPDRRDACPDTPLGALVDERGCPKDEDRDGVIDGLDRCPTTPEGAKVDVAGCSLDTDEDGVVDELDRCAGTARGAVVDETGCPLDGDGDGLPDGLDACPETVPGAHVDASGCALDADGDGVPDGLDACPDTLREARVDATGCLEPEPEPTGPPPFFPPGQSIVVLEGVGFEPNGSKVTKASAAILDEVADALRADPSLRIEIRGHTDSQGGAAANLDLSSRRAHAVRVYLAGHGVDPSRMIAKGYGERQPVATNATEAGRARNRRIELRRLD